MCRWAAWIGTPIFLEDILTRSQHSLIVQSHQAERCHSAVNADGFGVAWYDQRPEPGLYRDVYPAWSDPNLAAVARQVRSPLFLAHVRASTGSAISRNNCHPFAVGRWSFMHNGQVGGFESFRKQADMGISDALYPFRKGATDSEAIFLRAIGQGLDDDPVCAMQAAAAEMQVLSQELGTAPHMRLSAAFSDGENLFAVRYASDEQAPTLFYRYCSLRGGFMVVSEPLETGEEGWIEVPSGTICRFSRDNISQQPFLTNSPQLYAA